MPEKRIKFLLQQFLQNDCTLEERKELSVLLEQSDEQTVETLLEEAWLSYQPAQTMEVQKADDMLRTILAPAPQPSLVRSLWLRVASIAALFILVAWGVYKMANTAPQTTPVILAATPVITDDVAPGREGAILTLASGEQVVLDSSVSGNLLEVNGMTLNPGNGSLQVKGEANVESVVYHTMSTPRGRQYAMVLADGSKVWLNAASSIRFPSAFTGGERRVEITGEAYLEVAPAALREDHAPFIVSVNGVEVNVMGTHFNINAYPEEPTLKTTLLEGKVEVTRNGKSVILKPGEQAAFTADNKLEVKQVDVEEVIAWKNGFFKFNQTDMASLMRQAALWYDIAVRYKGPVPNESFSGMLSRSVNLKQFLKILEYSRVHAHIEGKTVIIQP
jgi:transmembrane sensor